MQPDPVAVSQAHPSSGRVWTGRVLSGLAVLFLAFDTAIKLLRVSEAVDTTVRLGYPAHLVPVIGGIQLVCLVLYVVPRTSILGAVLLTGYLGGAVATHVRVENPLFSHTLFPIYIASLLWLGLWLRDRRVRQMIC
jgi:hypothetical protein